MESQNAGPLAQLDVSEAAPLTCVVSGVTGGRLGWGDPRLKSSGLQPPILKSLKSMPGHTFKAPETNRVKSVKSGRFS